MKYTRNSREFTEIPADFQLIHDNSREFLGKKGIFEYIPAKNGNHFLIKKATTKKLTVYIWILKFSHFV
jgi:hypothetical protein